MRGILNGQRGTVRAIDRERQTVTVELDGGPKITLDGGYLAAGHLDHAYALTAHRAQGATVDHSFVLGSEDLYREWGYTALSRHRDEARFYVNRGDLGLERDQAPAPDPVIRSVARLLERSQAKSLALDGLHDLDEAALEAEHGRLRARFDVDGVPRNNLRTLRDDADRARAALDETQGRIGRLEAQLGQTSRLRRQSRGGLREQLASTRATEARLRERWELADAELARTEKLTERWMQRHGGDAARLIGLEQQRAERAHLERNVRARIGSLDRSETWLAKPERPALARDAGIHLHIGL